MNILSDLIQRISKGGTVLVGITLMAGMLLLVGNNLGLFWNFVIPGSYEIFELMMAIPVGFSLLYCALNKQHVVVDLITNRLPPRIAVVCEVFAEIIGFTTWALIAYAGTELFFENGLSEVSETLEVPYLPFRAIWSFCLFLFCLTYIFDIFQTFKRLLKK